MNIQYQKLKLLGRPFRDDGNGGESGGSAAGAAARGGMGFGGTGSGIGGDKSFGGSGGGGGYSTAGWSSSPSYSGYTTGSDQNAVTTDHVNAARDADKTVNNGTSAMVGMAVNAAATDRPMSTVVGRELTGGELGGLADNGLGDMQGVNANNATQSVNESIASRNMQGIVDRAINFVPGVATARSVANVAGALSDPNRSVSEVLGSAATGLIGSVLSSRANQAIAKALGPEASSAINSYNSLASTANTISPNSMSSINPAGMITSQLGLTSKQNTPMGTSGTSKLDGTAYRVGGWSAETPAVSPTPTTTPPPATPEEIPQNNELPSDTTLFGRGRGLINRMQTQRN